MFKSTTCGFVALMFTLYVFQARMFGDPEWLRFIFSFGVGIWMAMMFYADIVERRVESYINNARFWKNRGV
jgi:hypothetical protein